jgi:membrane protein implicated in regulation of membrane protease activity
MGIGDIGSLAGYLPVAWVVAAVLLAIIEALTMGLATIWFAIGAAVAAVTAMLGANAAVQVAVFLVVSILTLLLTRPIAIKKLKVGREKNVTQQMEGRRGIVVEAMAPFSAGLVKVGGVIWTAVGEDSAGEIDKGEEVVIVRIEGVKVIVKRA